MGLHMIVKACNTIRMLLFSTPIFFSLVAQAHEINSELEYMANEGVLFSHGENSVIFDSFYSDSINGTYLLLEKDTQESVLAAKPPYQNIKLAFVSHVHGDHFSTEPTLEYLRTHSSVRLLAPGQVIDALTKAGADDVKRQLLRVEVSPGETPVDVPVKGFKIKVAAVPHIGDKFKDVENLIFRVSIENSPTIAHLGDAAPENHWYPFLKDFFLPVDVALVPLWFITMDEGKEIVSEYIYGSHVIGIHLPSEARGLGKEYRDHYQNDMFTDPGERRAYDSSTGKVVTPE